MEKKQKTLKSTDEQNEEKTPLTPKSSPAANKGNHLPARRKAGEAPKQMDLPQGFRPPAPAKRVVLDEELELELLQAEAGQDQRTPDGSQRNNPASKEQSKQKAQAAKTSKNSNELAKGAYQVSPEQIWQEQIQASTVEKKSFRPPMSWTSLVPWFFAVFGVGLGLWMMKQAGTEKNKFDAQVQELNNARQSEQQALEDLELAQERMERLDSQLTQLENYQAQNEFSDLEEMRTLRQKLEAANQDRALLQSQFDELSNISDQLVKGGAIGLAQIVNLQSTDEANTGNAIIAWDAESGVGRLRWQGIPPLENGFVYQIWALSSTEAYAMEKLLAGQGEPTSQLLTVNLPSKEAKKDRIEEILISVEPINTPDMPSGKTVLQVRVKKKR